MFHIWVDVGVIPVSADIVTLLPPMSYRIGGAVSAAAVNQNYSGFHSNNSARKDLAGAVFPG